MQECDLAVAVEDDVGAELQGVVAACHADALAGEERAEARARNAGAQHPEWSRPVGAERLIQRSFRVGDDEGVPESELVAPSGGSSCTLWCDDDEPSACSLDLGSGLHDTAEVGATDVSAGVPREVHDGRMPEEVGVSDDVSVGVIELEGRERLHAFFLPFPRAD